MNAILVYKTNGIYSKVIKIKGYQITSSILWEIVHKYEASFGYGQGHRLIFRSRSNLSVELKTVKHYIDLPQKDLIVEGI